MITENNERNTYYIGKGRVKGQYFAFVLLIP